MLGEAEKELVILCLCGTRVEGNAELPGLVLQLAELEQPVSAALAKIDGIAVDVKNSVASGVLAPKCIAKAEAEFCQGNSIGASDTMMVKPILCLALEFESVGRRAARE